MRKQPDGVVLYGKIPNGIWGGKQKFVGKLQVPIVGEPQALIYDKSRTWSLFVPLDWIKDVQMDGEFKKYFLMWFDKGELHIDKEVKKEVFW